jgi:hypothetical protein
LPIGLDGDIRTVTLAGQVEGRAMAKKKAASIKVTGKIPSLTLSMPLDAKKVKAIQRCIDKGTLRITVSKVDLAAGRIGASWLYD